MSLGKLITEAQSAPAVRTDEQYFTLYWRHGDRNVIKGITIEEAFSKAGYGAGSVRAVDWFDNGISSTHTFDPKHKWVKKVNFRIKEESLIKGLKLENPFADDYLSKDILHHFMTTQGGITVTMENGDLYSIQRKFGEFHFGWLEYVAIEYMEKSPPDDEDLDVEYASIQAEYFPIKAIDSDIAINAFIDRLYHPTVATKLGSSLDDIFSIQGEPT